MHITIARIKTFASVSKETSPILVTRVLSKGKLNTDKKTFTSPSKNTARMEKKKENKNKKTNGNCRAFCVKH